MEDGVKLCSLIHPHRSKSIVHITYTGKEYDVYVLKCYAFCGGIYAYVMKEDGKVFNISVPRIVSAALRLRTRADAGAKLPIPDIDIDEALGDPFGIIRVDEPVTAVIKLRDNQGKYEMEKTWPDSVKIEQIDETTHLFTVTTHGHYWLFRWLESLGPQAEVLEPKWLRDKVKESLKYTVEEIYKDE